MEKITVGAVFPSDSATFSDILVPLVRWNSCSDIELKIFKTQPLYLTWITAVCLLLISE